MKILVLGASGMVGNAMMRVLSEETGWWVGGTVRNAESKQYFPPQLRQRLKEGSDVKNLDALVNVFDEMQPDVVINCVGLIKQRREAKDPLTSILINALVPHRLAGLCKLSGARLIHISTDCVFSGERGNYTEKDNPDAGDLYGKTKILGEVLYPHTVTVRTSLIGEELNTQYQLLAWFLAQSEKCKGYTRAVFSGLPTVVFAQVIRDKVIPNVDLSGLFHITANPINKHDLLQLIAKVYGKQIDIIPDEQLVVDRSLDGSLFHQVTGFTAPDWESLIKTMHAYQRG
ncbi:MAG: SDR family oxidoreductase [Pseudomonadota bacterium]